MRGQRFEEVLRNCREGTPLELTAEEKEHGWHYCPEDQGQLALQRLVGGKPWCGCRVGPVLKKPIAWACRTCGKVDWADVEEALAEPEHIPYRGVDIGKCKGKMIPLYSI